MIKYLHDRKICHRDVKPQNIIVTPENKLKLIDFNISKVWEEREGADEFRSRFITQVSTPLYAAPEIYSKKGYGEAIDIWGIGIISYLLLGGEADINIKQLVQESQVVDLPYLDYINSLENIPDHIRVFIVN